MSHRGLIMPCSNESSLAAFLLRNVIIDNVHIFEIKIGLGFKNLKFQAEIPMSSGT